MTKTKRFLAWTLISSSLLLGTGCADDRLMKTLGVGALVAGGTYAGSQLAGRGNRVPGAVIGGAATLGLVCMAILPCFGGSGITGGNTAR